MRKISPKTQRTNSKGMPSAPKSLPDSSAGSTVADCYDQTSLEEFASSTDLAMEKTMEEPSAIVESGDHDIKAQRTETASVERSSASVADRTRAHLTREVLLVAGDSSHEEG